MNDAGDVVKRLPAARQSAANPVRPAGVARSPVVVDLWPVTLQAEDCDLHEGMLSPAERRRAKGIVSRIAQSRFVAGRATLRRILSQYCGVEAERLPIQESAHGRPHLDSPFSDISFSVSDSGDFRVVAVSRQVGIGIDLEPSLRNVDALTSTVYWLHPGERRDLRARPPRERRAAFIGLWCRKEAVLKAEGSGLHFPLHHFRVSVAPNPAEVLVWPKGESPWRLYDLRVWESYTAALATNRPVAAIRHRELV